MTAAQYPDIPPSLLTPREELPARVLHVLAAQKPPDPPPQASAIVVYEKAPPVPIPPAVIFKADSRSAQWERMGGTYLTPAPEPPRKSWLERIDDWLPDSRREERVALEALLGE